MEKEDLHQDWIDKLIDEPYFKDNLLKLGEFEYFDDALDEPIIFKYWTDTRWKISNIGGMTFILSPAFWNDKQLEARFALICVPDFHLMVYIKKVSEYLFSNEEIIGEIGCHKILIDYNPDIKPNATRRIMLSPSDELLATIQNLDHFFTEEVPYFMSFDYNIVYQAINMIIDEGLASEELLELRCNEIKEILHEIIEKDKKDEDYNEINPQIYIQLKSLLDFEPRRWVDEFTDKIDFLKYFKKMSEIEGQEILERVKLAINMIIDKGLASDELLKVIKRRELKVFENNIIANVKKLPLQSKLILYAIYKLENLRLSKEIKTEEVYSAYSQLCQSIKIQPLTKRRINYLITELFVLGFFPENAISKRIITKILEKDGIIKQLKLVEITSNHDE